MNRIENAATQSTELLPLRGPEGVVPIACTPWLAVAAGAAFGWWLANGRVADDTNDLGFTNDAQEMSVGDLLKSRRDAISG
jgi:hypothetical protein